MRAALRTRLRAQIPGAVIDWGWNAEGATLPRAVLTVINGLDDATQDGASGLSQNRVQIDCFGRNMSEAVALANGVRTALHAWRGGKILGAFKIGERDMPPDTASGEVLARVSMDFMIHHKE